MTNYGTQRIAPVAMALALLVACSSPTHTSGTQLEPALEKFISPDALAVGNVHSTQVQQTAFYRRHYNELAGVVPSNTQQLLFVWDGKGLVIGIERKPGQPPQLSGDPRSVQSARRAAANGSGKLSGELSPALAWLASSDQAWIVSRGLPLQGVPLRSEYASLLSNFRGYIRATALGITASSGLQVRGRIECVSEAGSRRVGDALRAGLALARLTAKDADADDRKLYQAIGVRREGPSVFLEANFPPDLSDILVARLWRKTSR